MGRSKASGLLAALCLGVLAASTLLFAAPAGAQDGGGGQPQVAICHVEGNGSFHEITVALPAVPAHVRHGDIYPVPASGCPGEIVGGGGGGTTRVSVCHREGNGTFHEITIDDNALPAHLAHGDIYPVPAAGCAATPPPTTPPTVIGGAGGSAGGGTTGAATGVRAAPAPTPAPTAVEAAASTPAKVAELPHTGPGAVGVEAAIAVALLLLGGLCLRGSTRARDGAAAVEPVPFVGFGTSDPAEALQPASSSAVPRLQPGRAASSSRPRVARRAPAWTIAPTDAPPLLEVVARWWGWPPAAPVLFGAPVLRPG
jgi:hypothetical protein